MTTTDIAAEVRDYATVLELRDTQAVGAGRPYKYLEGRAVPYDTWADVGLFLERHASGSFKRSTNGRTGKNLPLLLFHDNASFPIGHAERWTHDEDGLSGVWQLNTTARAQQAAAMAEAGDLIGLSVGFVDQRAPVWEYPEDFDPFGSAGPDSKARVTRLESRLVEVSMTATPAFTDAAVTHVRHTRGIPPRPAPDTQYRDYWRHETERLRSGRTE